MEILQKDDGSKGSFFIMDGTEIVAEMTYVWAGNDRIIIDHTEVSEKLSGKGAGKQLVVKAVDFARERGIRIIPLCPFAKSVLGRIKDFNDVL